MSTKFDKMIEIITAMKEGKELQCRLANSLDNWTMTEEKTPNFQEYDYRIYHVMPKFRVSLMFDASFDYYYTFTINKESDEQTLQETPKFVNWVTPWIICSVDNSPDTHSDTAVKYRDRIVTPTY